MLNKDEIAGKAEQFKGKVKEGVGNMTGNERLKEEGVDDQDAGAVQETAGTVRRKVGETIEKVGNAIKK